MVIVTGKTYQNKNAIKALGFRWDSRRREWYKNAATDEEIAQLTALNGLIVEVEGGETFDTRSHKEKYGRCEDAPCCGCCGTHPYYGGE